MPQACLSEIAALIFRGCRHPLTSQWLLKRSRIGTEMMLVPGAKKGRIKRTPTFGSTLGREPIFEPPRKTRANGIHFVIAFVLANTYAKPVLRTKSHRNGLPRMIVWTTFQVTRSCRTLIAPLCESPTKTRKGRGRAPYHGAVSAALSRIGLTASIRIRLA